MCMCMGGGEGLCVHTAHGKHLSAQQSSGKIKIANKWSYCPNLKKNTSNMLAFDIILHNPDSI